MMDNLVILSFAEAKQPEYREKKGVGYIEFGDKNDYPNYLLGLYNKSAKHNAIVRGKVNYIIGNGWQSDSVDAQANLFIKSPNPYESLADLTRKVSIDIEVFGGAYLEVIWSKVGGMLSEVCHIDYTKIRSNKDNTQFWYKDWTDRKDEAKVIPAFNTQNRVGKQILYVKEYRPGLDTYALPSYMGALNYIESDVEVSKHVLGNAQTGFSASKLITLPNGEPSPDEKRNIERRFTERFSGSDGKKFILSFVQDAAKKPVVEDLGASDLTKEDFGRVDEMIQQNIFAGHQITTPSLFGISTPGSLGTRTEMRDGYEIFKNTYANDKQQFLESVFNQLATLRGVTSEITIVPIEPISYEFSEATIAANMTQDEIREKMGLPPLNQVENVTNPATPEPSQAMVNEHLKGMKGREWQNFQRIIREYNKGKISREQAAQMLKSAYGLGEEELATWLGSDEFSSDVDSIIAIFNEYGTYADNFSVLATRSVFGSDKVEENESQFFAEVVDDTLDKKILNVIDKNKGILAKDIAKALREDVGVIEERINKLKELEILKVDVKTGIPKLTQPLSEIIDKPIKTSFLVRYAYQWKSIVPQGQRDTSNHPSRPFCAKLMELNKLYTRAEIEMLSARLGYSVFDRGGGWWTMPDGEHSPSCRHQWVSKIVVKKQK
jgi:hypothetical protein